MYVSSSPLRAELSAMNGPSCPLRAELSTGRVVRESIQVAQLDTRNVWECIKMQLNRLDSQDSGHMEID